jgi:hypothetical protein
MLAGLNFLCLFCTVYKVNIPAGRTIKVYCDNIALVNWINRLLTDTSIPRMYIKPKTDVIMQIVHDLNQLALLHITIQIHHVKGHQDLIIPYTDLSRPAQLNVDADQYATNFLNQGTSIAYPELPANPVNLYISNQVITRKYKHELRKASCSQDLRVYLVGRMKWHPNTPDLVWWDIHGSSIRPFHSNDRRRIRKFIFRWLPTCERLQHYEPEISDQCPSCGIKETHAHILKCECISRAHIKNDWCETLKTFLYNNAYTPDLMGQILYNMAISSLTTTPPLPLPPSLPKLLQKACDDQQTIGWDQLLCGRLALIWGNLIANHLDATKIDAKEMTALTWGRKFVKLMFEITLKIWAQRNLDGHVVTSHNASQLTRDRLLANIATLQQSHPDISPGEYIFVHRPLETLEAYSLTNLQAWYRMAKNIVKNNVNRNRRRPPVRNVRKKSASNRDREIHVSVSPG